MTKLIIGIHGLANKSEKALLKKWWKTSIKEGLENISDNASSFKFEMMYWADLLYKYTIHKDADFYFDKLYNHEPYIKAKGNTLKPYRDVWADKLKSSVIETSGAGFTLVEVPTIFNK